MSETLPLFFLQCPSFYFFKNYVDELETAQTAVEEAEGDAAEKSDPNATVRLPATIYFPFKDTMVFGNDVMSNTNWCRLLRTNTNNKTSTEFPWRPDDATKWTARLESELGFDVFSEKAADYKKHNVAALAILNNPNIWRNMFQPRFAAAPASMWHSDLFDAWNTMFIRKKRTVSLCFFAERVTWPSCISPSGGNTCFARLALDGISHPKVASDTRQCR